MEGLLGFLITWTLASSIGFNTGVEHQIYYDRMMREQITQEIYDAGYEAGTKLEDLKKQIKLINLGIEYMND